MYPRDAWVFNDELVVGRLPMLTTGWVSWKMRVPSTIKKALVEVGEAHKADSTIKSVVSASFSMLI